MNLEVFKESVLQRQSIRSYDGEKLTDAITDQLSAFADDALKYWSATGVRISVVNIDNEPSTLITYGVVGGCRSYLVLISAKADRHNIRLGAAAMQLCVLEATRLGLATCWLGATFRRSVFASALKLNPGEEILAIASIGKSAKSRLVDRLMKTLIRSHVRREPSQLFFFQQPSTPIPADSQLIKNLEYLRLAPSSTNSQPWRVIVRDNQTFDLCSATDGRYTDLDLGIAMAHLAVGFAPQSIDFSNLNTSYSRLLSIARCSINQNLK